MSIDNNEARADLGYVAVMAAASRTNVAQVEDAGTAVADVLAYVAHLCDRLGLIAGDVFEDALRSYEGDFEDGPGAERDWDADKPLPPLAGGDTNPPIIGDLGELRRAAEELGAVAAQARAAATTQRGNTELLQLHQMLFPERYAPEVQPNHMYWENGGEGPTDPFQWNAGTIEWVAERLERALADHPEAVVGDRMPEPPAVAQVDDEGKVTCSRCGTAEFKYEEGHPSERMLRSNEDGVLAFDGDFEWFDGDDDPGVVCSNGHRVAVSEIEVQIG